MRLMIQAVFSAVPQEGGTNTLISIAKDDNATIRRNIEAAKLVRVPEIPDWMVCEHHW
ncbi:hypothetical protein ACFPYM_03950 [Methylobacterium hispanicum]|nr:hypothetical protein [Methylobacterium hispanicum]